MNVQAMEAHLHQRVIPFWEGLIDRQNGGFISPVPYD